MDREITITLSDKIGKAFNFSTLKQLHQFVKRERIFWEKQKKQYNPVQGLLGRFINGADLFKQVENIIDGWKPELENWDDQTLQQQFTRSPMQQALASSSQNWLWKGHLFIAPWFLTYEKHGALVSYIFLKSFVDNGQLGTINTKDNLKGALLAYEFDMQDESDLTRRRQAEKKSFSKIRADLIDAKDALFQDVKVAQDNYEDWDSVTRENAKKLYRVNKKLSERSANQYQSHFNTLLEKWKENISGLETTYKEKLRLEAPAEYWHKKANDNYCQALTWVVVLTVTLIIGMLGFGFLFDSWLKAQALEIQLNSLQGAVLFIAILSSYAFMVKTFAKLAFSAFHLQRDAEEREQLTHVYLALTHENDTA